MRPDCFRFADGLLADADANHAVEHVHEGVALVPPVVADDDLFVDGEERMLHGALAGDADGHPAALHGLLVGDRENADVGEARHDRDGQVVVDPADVVIGLDDHAPRLVLVELGRRAVPDDADALVAVGDGAVVLFKSGFNVHFCVLSTLRETVFKYTTIIWHLSSGPTRNRTSTDGFGDRRSTIKL